MKVSVSIEVVMELAARETLASKFKEIEPDHLFMALLKFSELPPPQSTELSNTQKSSIQEMISDMNTLSKEITARSIDSTKIRREIRSTAGEGNFNHSGGVIHRSEQSRKIFEQAVTFAANNGDGTLYPIHLFAALLNSPTPAMLKVMGKYQPPARIQKMETPRLDADGQDLSKVLNNEAIMPNQAAYSKVLLSVLSLKNISCIFFVSENDEYVRSISIAAALKFISGDSPPNLEGKRIIDISQSKKFITHRMEWIKQIFDEVLKAQDIILLLPPITYEFYDVSGWLMSLQLYLAPMKVQIICRISSEICKDYIQNSASWKKISHIIWIDINKESIPITL